jgi:hypothetical protein
MLQAHSLLWHYLWLAPHVLQLGLVVYIWRRGLQKQFPIFFAYLIYEATEEFTLYYMDLSPNVSGQTFWYSFCGGLILEGALIFALVGELFSGLVRPWAAVASLGNRLISGAGAVLVLLATLAAAYAPIDNPQNAIISRAHILEQTMFIIQCGLVLFLFLFASYFRLAWNHRTQGIALGLAIVSCEHMASWAVMASGAMMDKRHLLDFLNLATYHLCVLIWIYYFVTRPKVAGESTVPLPAHNLDVWNRELERLLQQ